MKYQFKTNINCGGCVASITPKLNANTDIKSWEVDTANPQKVLTVETDNLTADSLTKIVEKSGYKAASLN